MKSTEMHFCSRCGETVSQRVPAGDDRQRYICDACDTIHYQNPLLVVGSVPVYQNRVLLCRRAIEPRRGYWTLPAGFMENGESTLQGACRETWEEAGAKICDEQIYRVFDIPEISQVYIFYLARLAQPQFSAGVESLEVALFSEQEIPWDEIAFTVVTETLKDYFADAKRGVFAVQNRSILGRR